MAKKKASGANRSALVEKVNGIFKQITGFEDERAEVNASIAEQYARLKRMGFSVKAARASLARYKLETDARELWDETFDLTAEALGVAIDFQPDFFEDTEIYNPDAADETGEEPDNEDGDGEETHLTDEERAAAGLAGDGSGVQMKNGDGVDEQAEGETALAGLMPETIAAQG